MFAVRKLDFLISLYIFCIAVSELMGAKTFALPPIGTLHLNASVAILVIPLIYTINDVITEVLGAERARSVVRSGLIVILLFLLYSILATHLPASTRFLPSEKAYEQVFGLSARIAAASLIAFAIADFMDVAIFARLRRKLGKSKLWLRNNASNFISQFFDTAIFMVLAFYTWDKGLTDNLTFLWSLILPYWILKCFMSVIETPFVYLGVNWLKGEEKEK